MGIRKKLIFARINRLIREVSENPLSPGGHERLAAEYERQGYALPAIAEYRTAATLGDNDPPIMLRLARIYARAGYVNHARELCEYLISSPDGSLSRDVRNVLTQTEKILPFGLEILDHNRYYRLKTLAQKIDHLNEGKAPSILDVGGGTGELCLFTPRSHYVLAEPTINGISGMSLPFKKKSFDFVVACHVFEHIPALRRTEFLDEICTRARRHVLLLAPFAEVDSQRELQLIHELTGATWAKEHLECNLPFLADMVRYAEDRGYGYIIEPNGSAPLSLAMVFLDYYADKLKKTTELRRINELFNSYAIDKTTNPAMPTAHLVHLDTRVE